MASQREKQIFQLPHVTRRTALTRDIPIYFATLYGLANGLSHPDRVYAQAQRQPEIPRFNEIEITYLAPRNNPEQIIHMGTLASDKLTPEELNHFNTILTEFIRPSFLAWILANGGERVFRERIFAQKDIVIVDSYTTSQDAGIVISSAYQLEKLAQSLLSVGIGQTLIPPTRRDLLKAYVETFLQFQSPFEWQSVSLIADDNREDETPVAALRAHGRATDGRELDFVSRALPFISAHLLITQPGFPKRLF